MRPGCPHPGPCNPFSPFSTLPAPPTPPCSKLKLVLASSKRPAFAGRGRRQLLAPDLADLSATELLAALVPVLPSIRRHLDAGW